VIHCEQFPQEQLERFVVVPGGNTLHSLLVLLSLETKLFLLVLLRSLESELVAFTQSNPLVHGGFKIKVSVLVDLSG
jgi:hypothetical protein